LPGSGWREHRLSLYVVFFGDAFPMSDHRNDFADS